MIQIRKFGAAAGTFSVALGIGFVMQNGDALAARMGQPDDLHLGALPQSPEQLVQTTVFSPTLPDVGPELELPIESFTSPNLPAPAVLPEVVDTLDPVDLLQVAPDEAVFEEVVAEEISTPDEPAILLQPAPMVMAVSCNSSLSAVAAEAATVELMLSAPCAGSTQVTIHHQGMIFSAVTDADGQLSLFVPALTETAVFIADVGGETGAVAVVPVPDMVLYDRAVLQWQGNVGFELHAREFGADYDSAGHIWHNAAGSPSLAIEGGTGFLMQLGDPSLENGYQAQIYTYPSGNSSLNGDVVLTVEAEVDDANCGRTLAAQTLQMAPGRQTEARDLEMTLPGCETVGDVLVLNNMLRDLTLASR